MSACELEELVGIPVRLDHAGVWQLARQHADGFPLDGLHGGVTCNQHGDRIPPPRKCRIADREHHIPPLPTLTELHELIGETLRQQGFTRVQNVLGAQDGPL